MLDFDIYSDVDRSAAVSAELSAMTKTPTQSQLETMANYILFGKDQNGKNAVDRGEVQIQTKYSSYKRRKEESLDELTESPTFNEAELSPIHRSIYKNPKPEIDKSLPELQPLLQAIAGYETQLEELSAKPQTKEIKDQIYNLKHLIISLRKEQYSLQEIVRPPIQLISTNHFAPEPYVDNLCDNIGPLGLKIGNSIRFDNPKEDPNAAQVSDFYDPSRKGIDFENPTHIYHLIEAYESLYERSLDNPYIGAKYLIETLDWYIDQVPFAQNRLDIINLKKRHCPNTQIKKYLNEKYGFNYSENYISTIYTKEICKKIAAQVSLHREKWERRFEPGIWKKCSCCGEWKLKDAREFVRRKNSEDGFTSRCKICDRKKKLEKKKEANLPIK